ncbi:MAG: 50S ribosomal protein L9 [Candidatus Yanofskybacteria bacterium]|nr:50S ribosomal protein L9 [Candidatus Yanofskybacteria bacterium]
MKVILLKDVQNIGKRFDIKEVADGHARNFLIPEGLARQATKDAVKWVEAQKELLTKRAEQDLQKSQEVASQLDDLEVVLAVKVGEEGQLFESITAQKISDRLREMSIDIKRHQIRLDAPIKEIGEFPVKVSLDHNLEATIRVIISEAE